MSTLDFSRKESKAYIANMIMVAMELIAITISLFNRGLLIVAYYTQLSNLAALFGSALYLFKPQSRLSSALRFLSTVMLTMTMLITVCVLIPMGADPKAMLLGSSQIFHHVLCPIVSLVSYLCWEENKHEPVLLPILVTLLYGVIMLILNAMDKFDGPYPFLRIRKQGIPATVLWIAALLLLIWGISAGVKKWRNHVQKRA